MESKIRDIGRKLSCYFVLPLIFVSIGVLLFEGLTRFFLPASSEIHYLRPPYLQTTFKSCPECMVGVTGESHFSVNSQGLRADELVSEHTYRILAVGGSTTECLYLDQAKTWPQLLQQGLNESFQTRSIWVGNAGMSGLTSRHHLVTLMNLPLKKMQIKLLVILMGVNDFGTQLAYARNSDPDFLSDPSSLQKLKRESFQGERFSSSPFDRLRNSVTWRLLSRIKSRLFANHIQDSAGIVYKKWRAHRESASEFRRGLPDLSASLNEYESNMNKMIDIAKANSIPILFLTQPSLWKANLAPDLTKLLWMGGVGDYQETRGSAYYSPEALERGLDQYNQRMLLTCRKRKVDCVDLAPQLSKDTTVFYDDVHFNESGAQKVAGILVKHLVQQKPVSP